MSEYAVQVNTLTNANRFPHTFNAGVRYPIRTSVMLISETPTKTKTHAPTCSPNHRAAPTMTDTGASAPMIVASAALGELEREEAARASAVNTILLSVHVGVLPTSAAVLVDEHDGEISRHLLQPIGGQRRHRHVEGFIPAARPTMTVVANGEDACCSAVSVRSGRRRSPDATNARPRPVTIGSGCSTSQPGNRVDLRAPRRGR